MTGAPTDSIQPQDTGRKLLSERDTQTQRQVEEELQIIEAEGDDYCDNTGAPQAEIVETEAAGKLGDPVVGDNPLMLNAQDEVPPRPPEETVQRYPRRARRTPDYYKAVPYY